MSKIILREDPALTNKAGLSWLWLQESPIKSRNTEHAGPKMFQTTFLWQVIFSFQIKG